MSEAIDCADISEYDDLRSEPAARKAERLARKDSAPTKTHCRHGHPYDEANTLFTSRGYRYCRECKEAHDDARRRVTHCRHGHLYTAANTLFTSRGHRYCRECKRGRQSKQSQKNDLATIRPIVRPNELRAFRVKYRFTVSGLARALGMYRRSYQRWESGISQTPPHLRLALERLAQLVDDDA